MFDLANKKIVQSNTRLASEIIKGFSVYELITIAEKSNQKNYSLLDECSIIEEIIKSGEKEKILYLAASSRLNFDYSNNSYFHQIFQMGIDFRNALYANKYSSWYEITDSQLYIDQIIKDILQGPDYIKKTIYKNPKMDRILIASIIGARNFIEYKTKFNFETIKLKERYEALLNIADILEIERDYDIHDDMPSMEEQNFYKPIDASIILLKDLFLSPDQLNADKFLTKILARTNLRDFTLNNIIINWEYSKSENDNKNTTSNNTHESKKNPIEILTVINFLDEHTKHISSEIPNSEIIINAQTYFCRAMVALIIIENIFDTEDNQFVIEKILYRLLQDRNWILRAAGYKFLFQNIDIIKDEVALNNCLNYITKDEHAFLYAIFHSKHLNFLRKENNFYFGVIIDIFRRSNLNEKTKTYLEHIQYHDENKKNYKFKAKIDVTKIFDNLSFINDINENKFIRIAYNFGKNTRMFLNRR